MKKSELLTRLTDCGIVAVLRSETPEQAVKMAHALIEGGIYGIELTFSTPGVEDVVRELVDYYRERPEIMIGVGTVLDAVSARIALLAGALFIVSPGYDADTMQMCHLYQVPYLPGCLTITEIMNASKAGADIIKLFPGSLAKPEYIKAVKAPLPHVNIMPTGGVSLDNMHEWLVAGAIAVGIGGALSTVQNDNYVDLTQRARAYRTKFEELRG
ncbi:bifunctional 2-keto-4-hydroxyglutarate aldolase/2-keto-3-deoxy-6-phosphogluconate aldolase [Aerococcaceae bacterium NML190073]|nr:bifunctional 2-keto-4-hydroxyglutarate aldolase/2-keto-3-deoxy-6-phosphogluconate aldolase [Aerococcaceae bacterium NML190073]